MHRASSVRRNSRALKSDRTLGAGEQLVSRSPVKSVQQSGCSGHCTAELTVWPQCSAATLHCSIPALMEGSTAQGIYAGFKAAENEDTSESAQLICNKAERHLGQGIEIRPDPRAALIRGLP